MGRVAATGGGDATVPATYPGAAARPAARRCSGTAPPWPATEAADRLRSTPGGRSRTRHARSEGAGVDPAHAGSADRPDSASEGRRGRRGARGLPPKAPRRRAARRSAGAHPRWPMTDTTARRARPPRRQALHLRLGRRHGRGRRDDARPARRQGRRPGRDDHRRPARPARLHDHDRGLQRLLRGRRAAARRPLGRRPRRGPGGRARRPARASATRPTRSSSPSARAPSSRCPG